MDNNKAFRALLTDLLKGFDCLSYGLLIAKLYAYGLDLASLKILLHYLTNRKQSTKVDSFYSFWKKILSGVPPGSILGPILFNIFMCDMFLILKAIGFTLWMIIPRLWLEKIQPMLLKLLKILVKMLKFTNHIDKICKAASQKLNAIARIAPYMGICNRRISMNTFFKPLSTDVDVL